VPRKQGIPFMTSRSITITGAGIVTPILPRDETNRDLMWETRS
jgi:hypothetical protein